jgi:hypothetical protein
MNIFQIGNLMEAVQQAYDEGAEPDPAHIALLVEEGPAAVEKWWDMIDMAQADVELLAQRIKDLRARKEAREQTVERMKGALQDILNRHFSGKLKTATLTTWTQKTTSYTVTGATPDLNPTFFKFPEPELKKTDVVRVYKEGVLPDNVTVEEGFSESVRVKR